MVSNFGPILAGSAEPIPPPLIQCTWQQYKKQYDRRSHVIKYQSGEWVLVRFPADETGRHRKFFKPWHGPFQVTSVRDPDFTVGNVYIPQDKHITVHQTIVKLYPTNFPARGFIGTVASEKVLERFPTG